ncbi:MAG TPA: hypothetical protein VJ603_05330 [Paucimonas sp.]|nr:hypothetical protein [Paucimonas sp.]HJW57726.1 hypothetical protein [Burkholderiaceae bacterium]
MGKSQEMHATRPCQRNDKGLPVFVRIANNSSVCKRNPKSIVLNALPAPMEADKCAHFSGVLAQVADPALLFAGWRTPLPDHQHATDGCNTWSALLQAKPLETDYRTRTKET